MPDDKHLVRLLEEKWNASPDSFWREGTVNYHDRFNRIAQYLNTNIHPHTLEGALAAQIARITEAVAKGKEGGELENIVIQNNSWLTDHGPDHIETVIKRASKLVSTSGCDLLPYEIYLLLVAIHFHDVGNIFGREEHEKRITQVMAQIGEEVMGDDDLERRLIRDIACAHGGKHNGDQDTIRHLPYLSVTKDPKVRPHLLAAILRFADELAEDFTRASRFAMNNALLLKASEVYHIYADRLRRVVIEDGNVDIHFEISKDIATKKFGKGHQQVFLIDEIFNRSVKIHREHAYCMRYMRREINVSSVTVHITIFKSPLQGFRGYMDPLLPEFAFKMEERGYPGAPTGGVHDICDNLKDQAGKVITGESLCQKLQSMPE